jgi:hypothetical protein
MAGFRSKLSANSVYFIVDERFFDQWKCYLWCREDFFRVNQNELLTGIELH